MCRDGRQYYFYHPLPITSGPVGPPIFLYPARPVGGALKNPNEDLESTEIKPPPADASVAEAKPVGIAIAGPGGVAQSQPIGQAIVGPGGLAIARPIGTAIAGVPGITGVPGAGGQPDVEEPPKITIYYNGVGGQQPLLLQQPYYLVHRQ